jgi:hypothetical protein
VTRTKPGHKVPPIKDSVGSLAPISGNWRRPAGGRDGARKQDRKARLFGAEGSGP